MQAIIDKLRGGDRRSIGRATEVVREIEDNPALFKAVFTGLFDDEPVVRMRSADVIEKVTQGGPELLKGYTSKVISILATAEQQEICWHMAQIAPRLQCNTAQEDEIVELLKNSCRTRARLCRLPPWKRWQRSLVAVLSASVKYSRSLQCTKKPEARRYKHALEKY